MTFSQLSTTAVLGIGIVGLIVTIGASEVLVRGVGRLGKNLGLLGGLLGLIIALGADSPEISSAVISTVKGSAATGVGVIIGSNAFNIAVLFASATFVAGRLSIQRASLLIDAGVAILITIAVGAAILGGVPLAIAWVVIILVFPLYVAFLSLRPETITRLSLPGRVTGVLVAASGACAEEGDGLEAELEGRYVASPGFRSWIPVLLAAPAIILIILGALTLVQSSITLGHRWGIPNAIVGLVGLAAATSLPNAYAATRLAQDGRGTAVVSATFNSNTLNLIAGFAVPAIFLMPSGSLAPASYVVWLLVITTLAVILLLKGLRWKGAVALLLTYIAFIVFALITS